MNWYVIKTKPYKGKVAEGALGRLNIEVFSPQLEQERVIRRKRRRVAGPLFPGYLFARFNANLHFQAANYAQGVQNVVVFGATPAVMDVEVIESIRSLISEGGNVVKLPSLAPGQTVRIQEGPWKGLEAIFEREITGQKRVVLLLQTLSYAARIVVDRKSVARAQGLGAIWI